MYANLHECQLLQKFLKNKHPLSGSPPPEQDIGSCDTAHLHSFLSCRSVHVDESVKGYSQLKLLAQLVLIMVLKISASI